MDLRCLALCALALLPARAAVFDVTAYGAKADSKTSAREAIRKAVDAAAAAGGGTVYFPAGTYLTGSIQLRSNLTLHFERGAILEASANAADYDPPEPNAFTQYQDFGHSHWHNSLIWGEGIENVAIVGGGLIVGKGLGRGSPQGGGDKTIALKLCRNVTLRDFSILNGGHFGILATGVDNLTIDNLKIDTNRDGIDIDACRNVRISNTSVNSPNDDAIVLKTTYALGARPTEAVTIANCLVSGYDIGSLLDGSYKRTQARAPDRDGPTGRIKIGTETDGDFRNITITNVVFDRSRGLALEAVDGGKIEDVVVSNLTMREVSNSPIFLRLGTRQRAPEGAPVSAIRRVRISNVVAYDADPRYGSILSGVPGHDIEDVTLSGIRIVYRGGLSLDEVAKQPADVVNSFFFRGGVPPREPYATPEREKEYPEPSMFGLLPAYGFFIRHASGVRMSDIQIGYVREDRRPAFVLEDVKDADLSHVKAQTASGVPTFVLRDVARLSIDHCPPVRDTRISKVIRGKM